ncbi:MAG: DUF3576 domain-containing protein [Boseongicola sp.]|nr:DUF3576 domain-containing protein [Boseongicola sp.]
MRALARIVAGRALAPLALAVLLSGCGTFSNVFNQDPAQNESFDVEEQETTIWDLFGSRDDPNVTIEVNKYIWNATFDVLDFLPIQTADPFTGIIVTGFGTPPGGGTAYRATVFIRDPALEARSLNLALATRAGPAPTATVRAVEDAILTRARQLRIQDLNL